MIAYPGEITRLKLTFEREGRFVWHCHVLEHEDNEMMRPYVVGEIKGPHRTTHPGMAMAKPDVRAPPAGKGIAARSRSRRRDGEERQTPHVAGRRRRIHHRVIREQPRIDAAFADDRYDERGRVDRRYVQQVVEEGHATEDRERISVSVPRARSASGSSAIVGPSVIKRNRNEAGYFVVLRKPSAEAPFHGLGSPYSRVARNATKAAVAGEAQPRADAAAAAPAPERHDGTEGITGAPCDANPRNERVETTNGPSPPAVGPKLTECATSQNTRLACAAGISCWRRESTRLWPATIAAPIVATTPIGSRNISAQQDQAPANHPDDAGRM